MDESRKSHNEKTTKQQMMHHLTIIIKNSVLALNEPRQSKAKKSANWSKIIVKGKKKQ